MVIPEQGNHWVTGHIVPWWDQHRDLSYINEEFNDPNSIDLWRHLGYTQSRFTGDMYDMRFEEPPWVAGFRLYFPWRFFSWSFYRMPPGTVLPRHSDTYNRFINIYEISDPTVIHRAVIFLEDWSSGHYFEINGQPLIQWCAGDWVTWRYDTPHLAANVGMTDRYTLQITGIPDENSFL